MRHLSEAEIADFKTHGCLVVPGFYDFDTQIAPIREGIRRIVGLLCRKHGLDVSCDTAEAAMVDGYLALIKKDRSLGGQVYDAVKQIPSFMSLVSSDANAVTFQSLRKDAVPGLAAGGYGIRIDNPSEDKFRAIWHQEFPAQLRSLDGIVFWSPLLEVSPEMGPVQIAKGSHKEGPVPVYEDDGGVGKSGAYALRLEGEQERLAKYEIIAPCTKPGDLVLMDFLTLHQSGKNVSNCSRWSMQWRLFNFADPVGIDIAWAGSFAQGTRFEDILPGLKVSAAQ